jgi:hypothetical protein
MRLRWLLLVLLLIVAGLGWRMIVRDAPPTATVAPAHASGGRAIEPAAAEEAQRREAVGGASDAPAAGEDAQRRDVQVVDKASGEPVPDADIAWRDDTSEARIRALPTPPDWMAADEERAARTYGAATRSNHEGVAHLRCAGGATVFARSGTRYGSLWIAADAPQPPGGHRLEIEDDHTLCVRVLDAADAPVSGVGIAFEGLGADRMPVPGRVWKVASTDPPDGIARIRHVQRYRARPPAVHWCVRLHLPGHRDPGVEFDPAAPPAEPIVLRLPPCGRVKVRAELLGRRMPGFDSAGLYIGEPGDMQARNEGLQQPVDADGWARFPFVALGQTYVACTFLDDVEQKITGPVREGQEVSVTLGLPDDVVVLTGLVLDERREPVRKGDLGINYSLEGSKSWSVGASETTDADGRFLHVVGKIARDDRLEGFSIEWTPADAAVQRIRIATRTLQPGVQDLGTLQLSSGPLLCSGRLVLGSEPYLRRVWFAVDRQDPDAAQPAEGWQGVDDVGELLRPDGTFALRGATAPGRLRLRIGADELLPTPPVEFAAGATNLVVQVAVGTPLTATALVPPDLPWGLLAILRPEPLATVTSFAAATRASIGDAKDVEPSGQGDGRALLHWSALAAGRYTLELRLWGDAQPLLAVSGIEVPSAAPDPRLRDIDLRERIEVLTVRVVDADSGVVRGAGEVFVMPQDPAHEWFGHPLKDGAASFPVRTGPADLAVIADEYRPATVRGARGEVSVMPTPRPAVQLVFDDVPELPAGFALDVRLEPPASDSALRYRCRWRDGMRGSDSYPPAQQQEVLLRELVRLPIGDGPQQLTVLLRSEAGERAIPEVAPSTVSAGTAPVHVRLPAAALQRALAELQRSEHK